MLLAINKYVFWLFAIGVVITIGLGIIDSSYVRFAFLLFIPWFYFWIFNISCAERFGRKGWVYAQFFITPLWIYFYFAITKPYLVGKITEHNAKKKEDFWF